jgi:hypothetical protein
VYRRSSAKTWADSTLVHAIRSIRWLEKIVGKYPYPHITVAESLRSGGMEYPMFVMDGRASEGLAMHEIGHVYFYGILANDEREEAWLDEGFTTFQTRWYQTVRYGPWGDKSKWNWYQRMTPQYRLWEKRRRLRPDRRGYGERVVSRLYTTIRTGSTYTKAPIVRNTLPAGRPPTASHEYFGSGSSARERGFRKVCEDVAPRSLAPVRAVAAHAKTVDYELGVRTRPDSSGVHRSGGEARAKLLRLSRL